MEKDNRSLRSSEDQDSLGILNMQSLKAFGDISECSISNVSERLVAERHKARDMLDNPRPRSSRLSTPSISTNISELITDETIDLNTSGSLDLGRSSLGLREKPLKNKAISVSDILKTSRVEKARQLEKMLQPNSTSILRNSSSFSSLNGGSGFSFGSTTGQNCDESFAPAELMQSKLISGEISWAQQYTAMPTATLSKQALEKIRAPVPTSDIESSRSNSISAKDHDFSLGNYFQTRSENLWNVVGAGNSLFNQHKPQSLVETPERKNRTYTKTVERASYGDHKKQRSSEILSLSAIDKALKNLDLDSNNSSIEVFHRLKGEENHLFENDENKENDQTICNDSKQKVLSLDDWPSTPIKSPRQRLYRTKSSSINVSDRMRLTTSTEGEEDKKDNNETPVNKSMANVRQKLRQPTSLSSTRLDDCRAQCEFGTSPNLPNNVSAKSSPKSYVTQSSTAESERCNGLTSRCSNSSSEFSHRGDKRLPLKVTQTSLCWGSTKLRTDVKKSLQIKNIAQKRLSLRLGIQGPGYQLVGNEFSTITLQALECRTITINFCPTVCGAAVGALQLGGAHQAELKIPLYGYGGNASISIQGLLKGPVGSSFLTIGDVCELSSGTLPLRANCRFYNKGPLTAFVSISVESALLMKLRLSDAFVVHPSQIVLPPHTEGLVEIEFHPSRDDMKNILKKFSGQQVLTLANMRIFCGDEPNRQRMRNLIQRMGKRQQDRLTSTMLDSIWTKFPEEQNIGNLSQLNEPAEFILDLVTVVRIIDVALTLNRDFDESAESSMLFLPDADETVLFRTICPASSAPTGTTTNWSLDP